MMICEFCENEESKFILPCKEFVVFLEGEKDEDDNTATSTKTGLEYSANWYACAPCKNVLVMGYTAEDVVNHFTEGRSYDTKYDEASKTTDIIVMKIFMEYWDKTFRPITANDKIEFSANNYAKSIMCSGGFIDIETNIANKCGALASWRFNEDAIFCDKCARSILSLPPGDINDARLTPLSDNLDNSNN